MVLVGFPDLQWLKTKAEQGHVPSISGKPNLKGWPNVILNVANADCYRDNIKGPLSIFTNVKGESAVSVDGKRNVIREGFYYVTNQEQYYTLETSANTPTDTFNIHFGTDFIQSLWQSISNRPEHLLDEQFNQQNAGPLFYNRLNRRSQSMDEMINLIRIEKQLEPLLFEEKLVGLSMALLTEEKELLKIRFRIPAVKGSTKSEILKRLTFAVDFIYAHYNQPINLQDLADTCCLSKFHFLRLFKLAYQQTPGEFIDQVRITKAKEILKREKPEIRLLAKNLGYNHSSAFSRMFKNHVGVYPTQFA